eukprot:Polyplicarium_translucidae@DN2444_c0_g1_i3.p1
MEDFETASPEALHGKLQEYRASLDDIEKALEAQPNEPQLLRLKNDLEVVVNLIEDLVKFREDEGADVAIAPAPEPEESRLQSRHSVPTADAAHRSAVAASVAAASAAAAAAAPAAAEPAGAPPIGQTGISVQTVGSALIGRTCLALHEGEKLPAEIISFRKDPKAGSKVTVELIGYGTQEEVAINQIELLQPASPALLTPGTRCQAIFSEDGRWYECDIEEQTPNGYNVRYSNYGNREEVKFDRVRLHGETVDGQRKRKVKEVITAGGFRIPEYLQVKSTDTEKQKQIKKKKSNLLKKEQRKEQIEKEAKARQGCWQSHAKKNIDKRAGRSNQDSIFRSSSLPEAKVGVTRSGEGMTSFGQRTRHVFDRPEEEN